MLKQGLQIEPSNDAMITAFEEMKKEYEEDTSIPEDHPEKVRFNRLIQWLRDGGSKFEKLKIRFYSADYRGVHAARDIKKGEIILYVPKE